MGVRLAVSSAVTDVPNVHHTTRTGALDAFQSFLVADLLLWVFVAWLMPIVVWLGRLPPPDGVLYLHPAGEGSTYAWFHYVPRFASKLIRHDILITGVHANLRGSLNDEIAESRRLAEARIPWAEEHGYILLVPVIPWQPVPNIYTAGFDWRCFLESTPVLYRRPDEQVNHMIDRLRVILAEQELETNEKVFLEGFSAGGEFVQRYALLQPERVAALAVGHCGGWLTLPEETLDDTPLHWPAGVRDFEPLARRRLNTPVYLAIPHYIYIGDRDTLNSQVYPWDMWPDKAEIELLNRVFGADDPQRLQAQAAYLQRLGGNVTFKLYPGAEHDYTAAMIDDLFAFLERYRIKQERPPIVPLRIPEQLVGA